MKNRTLAMALPATLMLASILAGCKPGQTGPRSPAPVAAAPAAAPPAAPSPAAPAPGQPTAPSKTDQAQVAELTAKLKAATDDAARAQAFAESLRRENEEDRKKAAATDEKLWIFRQGYEALRDRLFGAGQGDWVIRVEASAFENPKDVEMKSDERAGTNKVMVFNKPTSSAELTLPVRTGFYKVIPVGLAVGGPDHDAMNLTVKAVEKDIGEIDIDKRVCFDQNFEAFGDASGSPSIAVKRPGTLKVTLKPTEETGMSVSRLELRIDLPP